MDYAEVVSHSVALGPVQLLLAVHVKDRHLLLGAKTGEKLMMLGTLSRGGVEKGGLRA